MKKYPKQKVKIVNKTLAEIIPLGYLDQGIVFEHFYFEIIHVVTKQVYICNNSQELRTFVETNSSRYPRGVQELIDYDLEISIRRLIVSFLLNNHKISRKWKK